MCFTVAVVQFVVGRMMSIDEKGKVLEVNSFEFSSQQVGFPSSPTNMDTKGPEVLQASFLEWIAFEDVVDFAFVFSITDIKFKKHDIVCMRNGHFH